MSPKRLITSILIVSFFIMAVPGSLAARQPLIPDAQNDSLQRQQTHSFKSYLLRSAVGSAIGGMVGAGMGGVIPIWLDRDYDNRSFPDKTFYLSSYVGASLLAGLSSATALYLYNEREISWWSLASYSLLPSMIIVLPVSAYASTQDRDEALRAAWIATAAAIGVSTVWNAVVYGMYPPRNDNRMAIHFARPRLMAHQGGLAGSPINPGMNIVEIHF